jgi:hypothetical protein
MATARKQAKRSDRYQTMAAGYHILGSPLAGSYRAAAAHYRESDPPHDPADAADRPGRLDTAGWENVRD